MTIGFLLEEEVPPPPPYPPPPVGPQMEPPVGGWPSLSSNVKSQQSTIAPMEKAAPKKAKAKANAECSQTAGLGNGDVQVHVECPVEDCGAVAPPSRAHAHAPVAAAATLTQPVVRAAEVLRSPALPGRVLAPQNSDLTRHRFSACHRVGPPRSRSSHSTNVGDAPLQQPANLYSLASPRADVGAAGIRQAARAHCIGLSPPRSALMQPSPSHMSAAARPCSPSPHASAPFMLAPAQPLKSCNSSTVSPRLAQTNSQHSLAMDHDHSAPAPSAVSLTPRVPVVASCSQQPLAPGNAQIWNSRQGMTRSPSPIDDEATSQATVVTPRTGVGPSRPRSRGAGSSGCHTADLPLLTISRSPSGSAWGGTLRTSDISVLAVANAGSKEPVAPNMKAVSVGFEATGSSVRPQCRASSQQGRQVATNFGSADPEAWGRTAQQATVCPKEKQVEACRAVQTNPQRSSSERALSCTRDTDGKSSAPDETEARQGQREDATNTATSLQQAPIACEEHDDTEEDAIDAHALSESMCPRDGNDSSGQPRLLLQSIRLVFAAVGLPPPLLDTPTLRVFVHDFEMQSPHLSPGWEDNPECCAQCARHVCSLLFELATGERVLVPIGLGLGVPLPLAALELEGTAADWASRCASLAEPIRKLLATWEDPDQQRLFRRLFRRADVSRAGVLRWRAGEVCVFVRLVCDAHHFSVPQCPAAVWYQFLRESGIDLSASLTEENCVKFFRLVFDSIISLHSSVGQYQSPIRGEAVSPDLLIHEKRRPAVGQFAADDRSPTDYAKSLFDCMQNLQLTPRFLDSDTDEKATMTADDSQQPPSSAEGCGSPPQPSEELQDLPSHGSDVSSSADVIAIADRLSFAALECAKDHARICEMMRGLRETVHTDPMTPPQHLSPSAQHGTTTEPQVLFTAVASCDPPSFECDASLSAVSAVTPTERTPLLQSRLNDSLWGLCEPSPIAVTSESKPCNEKSVSGDRLDGTSQPPDEFFCDDRDIVEAVPVAERDASKCSHGDGHRIASDERASVVLCLEDSALTSKSSLVQIIAEEGQSEDNVRGIFAGVSLRREVSRPTLPDEQCLPSDAVATREGSPARSPLAARESLGQEGQGKESELERAWLRRQTKADTNEDAKENQKQRSNMRADVAEEEIAKISVVKNGNMEMRSSSPAPVALLHVPSPARNQIRASNAENGSRKANAVVADAPAQKAVLKADVVATGTSAGREGAPHVGKGSQKADGVSKERSALSQGTSHPPKMSRCESPPSLGKGGRKADVSASGKPSNEVTSSLGKGGRKAGTSSTGATRGSMQHLGKGSRKTDDAVPSRPAASTARHRSLPTAAGVAAAVFAAAEAAASQGSTGWAAAAAAVAAAAAHAKGGQQCGQTRKALQAVLDYGRSVEVQTEAGHEEATQDSCSAPQETASFGASDTPLLNVSSSAEMPCNEELPQLLAMVQATCASLAERLKAQQLPHGAGFDGRDPASRSEPSSAPPAAVIAAAMATRHLLSEVETAFPAGRPTGAVTQWFTVGTPATGGASSAVSAVSSLTYGTRPKKQRHSWPNTKLHSGWCNLAGSLRSPDDLPDFVEEGSGNSGVHGESLDELRSVDPCPLLRPPHVVAPRSPRERAQET